MEQSWQELAPRQVSGRAEEQDDLWLAGATARVHLDHGETVRLGGLPEVYLR